MQNRRENNSGNPTRRSLMALAATALLTLSTITGFGQNVGIFSIDSTPYNHSYGQWAVAWWQWALSIPAAVNPVTDSTGQFADVGQSGPVWFLGSTFGASEKRTLTIPAGRGIFLPVYQWIFGASVGDCKPS